MTSSGLRALDRPLKMIIMIFISNSVDLFRIVYCAPKFAVLNEMKDVYVLYFSLFYCDDAPSLACRVFGYYTKIGG